MLNQSSTIGGWHTDNRWSLPTQTGDQVGIESNYDAMMDMGVRFVDLNGDGLVDIIQGIGGGYSFRRAWLNTGSGWIDAPQFAAPTNFVWRAAAQVTTDEGVRFVDVNGDGLPDIVQNEAGGGGVIIQHAWLNTGSGWKAADQWTPPVWIIDRGKSPIDNGVRFADINGDGLTDIIQSVSGLAPWAVSKAWLNTGGGWTPAPASWNPPIAITYRDNSDSSIFNGVEIVDINGDGLPDLVMYQDGQRGHAAAAYLNTGGGWTRNDAFVPPIRLVDAIPNGSADEGVRLVDMNGDGLVDMVQSQGAISALPLYNLHRAIIQQGDPPNLLAGIKNELGGFVQVTYGSAAQFGQPLPMPVTVVKSVTADDGMGSAVSTHYSYSGGKYTAR